MAKKGQLSTGHPFQSTRGIIGSAANAVVISAKLDYSIAKFCEFQCVTIASLEGIKPAPYQPPFF